MNFAYADSRQVHTDANNTFDYVHQALDCIVDHYNIGRPGRIDGFVLAPFGEVGGHCFGNIAFRRTAPAIRGCVWHEYGHSIHYHMTNAQNLSSSAIGEAWAYCFELYVSHEEVDDDWLYQPIDTPEHSWGRVYSSVLNDIMDGYAKDDDPMDGQALHTDARNGTQVNGEMMVWRVIMEDEATSMGDFYRKFLGRYKDLKGSLDDIYRAHGLTPPGANTVASGLIPPTGTTTTTALIDSTVTEGRFSVSWPGSDLDLTLMSPSGTSIDPTYAEQDPNITYVEEETQEYYLVEHPEPGQWQIHVTAVDVPADGESYTLTTSLTTSLMLILSGDKETYVVGEPIALTARLLYDGNSYSDATVVACIQTAQGTDTTRLFDDGLHNDGSDGDGVYANACTIASAEGQCTLTATASGRNPFGEPFVREASKTVVVQNLPDLVALDLTVDSGSVPGQTILTATVWNDGSKDAADVLVQFYDASDANVVQLGDDITVSHLGSHEAADASSVCDIAQGIHTVFVVVDYADAIHESRETNNYISRVFCVQCESRCDLNNDAIVNLCDFGGFAGQWKNRCRDLDRCLGADLDWDGQVDWADLSVFCECWLWQRH